MLFENLSNLKTLYDSISEKFPNFDLEPFNTIENVMKHRFFWKPSKTRIILLAESHVFTTAYETQIIMNYPSLTELSNCPKNYVRLVYCLGYGEKQLCNIKNNTGTWQFWKIFSSCVSRKNNFGFNKILKSKTPEFLVRIRNKVKLLQQLQHNGIWLLDASIVALYKRGHKPNNNEMNKILNLCWDIRISEIIQAEQPEKLIIIGKGVERALKKKLDDLSFPYFVQPQPQARLSSKEISEVHQRYYDLIH